MSSSIQSEYFRRFDETPDEYFYQSPRFVTHIDDAAIREVTQLYREYFPEGGEILDLMSSWISHLPEERTFSRVVGLGMNHEELARNPRLTEFMVQNLNENPALPFADESFDGCGICVSIQYLTDPIAVLREVGRVLRADAPIVITFSNRCFPTKAVAVWQGTRDQDHLNLVMHYLVEAGNWTAIEGRQPTGKYAGDPLFAVIARAEAKRPMSFFV